MESQRPPLLEGEGHSRVEKDILEEEGLSMPIIGDEGITIEEEKSE